MERQESQAFRKKVAIYAAMMYMARLRTDTLHDGGTWSSRRFEEIFNLFSAWLSHQQELCSSQSLEAVQIKCVCY